MRDVLEYWWRDFEIDFRWHRDSSFEGPYEEEWLDPPDTVADVRSALEGGATKVLVACTSHRNRLDLAGRLAADFAASNAARSFIVYPDIYRVVAKSMLQGHVSDADVGSTRAGRKVALVAFDHVREADVARDDLLIILSGAPPRQAVTAAHPRAIADEEIWTAAAQWLAGESNNCRRVEFALAHSRPMLDYPNAVIDAGRLSRSGL